VRSLINVVNGLEVGYSYGDRFEHLKEKVQETNALLMSTHTFFDTKASDKYIKYEKESLSERLKIYRLEDDDEISSFYLPCEVAITLYLDEALYANGTIDDLKVPQELLYDKNFTFQHDIEVT